MLSHGGATATTKSREQHLARGVLLPCLLVGNTIELDDERSARSSWMVVRVTTAAPAARITRAKAAMRAATLTACAVVQAVTVATAATIAAMAAMAVAVATEWSGD